MKNILKEKPDLKLFGRSKYATEFVENNDIKNKRMLDIGCGYGWFELNALKRGALRISGIEITSADLNTARKNIKDRRAEFKIGGALKLPFESDSFDTVVAWEVVEHIPKGTEEKMFREIKRVLKKNGVFYLSTPFDSFFSKYLDPAWWLIGHRHYSEKLLTNIGEKSGFKIRKMDVQGGAWTLLGLLNMYFCKWFLQRKPLLEGVVNSKIDGEHDKSRRGFMGIFVKYQAFEDK